MRITERGQLTIPKELRVRYGITPATELEVVEREEGLLIVKRMASSPFARFLGAAGAKGTPASTDRFLAILRDEQDDEDESGRR